jgi:uncharacterized protein
MNSNVITIIVKPISECNFRCKYCYHANTQYEPGILAPSKLEKLIKLTQEEYDRVEYVWHGGEPLLCGIDYFEKIVKLQKKYKREESLISNSVQTNGSLLSNQFIKFFKKNDFSVSVSIDGPGECNSLRQSTKEVMNNIDSALGKGLRLSTISVIHALNCDHQIEIYEYFKSKNLPMKFNPIFNSGATKHYPEYLLEIEQYIRSLKSFYDYWLFDQTAVRVDPLDQYIHMRLAGRGTDCIYGSCLYHWFGVDHNGAIYPCGRSFGSDYQIGSIEKIDYISDIFKHGNYIDLLKKSIVRRSFCQNNCDYYVICNGGCNNNALIENGRIDIAGGFLCEVLKEMYEYVNLSIDSILSNKGSLEEYNPLIRQALNRMKLTEVFGE